MNHITLINCTVTRAPESRVISREGKPDITLHSFTVVDPGWKRDTHLSKFVRITVNSDSLFARDIPNIAKGSKVTVGGRLDMREYDARDGTKKYEFEISRPEYLVLHASQPADAAAFPGPSEPAADPPNPWTRTPF